MHSEENDGTLGMCECVRVPLPSDYGDLDVKAVSRKWDQPWSKGTEERESAKEERERK